MQQLNPVNPGLAQVLGAMDMISPVTPEGTPTVASQVMQAAQQAMAPQPQMPNVQDIAQDAGIGNQVQMQQQQAQQQEMMQALQQMMQQRQQQDNAMRFGVAAAPGAQSVRMAEGGIVGYAAGNPEPHPLEDKEKLKQMLERLAQLRRRAGAEAAFADDAATAARAAAPAAEAATARTGLGALLRTAGAGGMRALGPLGAIAAPLLFGISTRGGNAQVGGGTPAPTPTPPANDDYQRQRVESAYRDVNRPEFGLGTPPTMPAADEEVDVRETMRRPAPDSGLPALIAPTTGAGPRKSDEYATGMRNILSQFEVGTPQRAEVERQLAENREITNAALRAAGLKPDQRALDEAESRARQTRREEGIGQLRSQSEEARGGINRMIELLSGGAGRVVSGGIGQQYTNMLRRDLAENERFMNAMERARTEGEIERVALREKERADVIGDVKTSREQAAKAMEARNKKREAELTMTTELYKTERKSEDAVLDRQHQVAIEQFRASVQRGVNEGLRREQVLRNIDLDRNRFAQGFERLYREKVRDLGILDPSRPTPEQRQALNKLEAERDAAIAKLEAEAAEARTRIMGGGGGSAIKVEPIKSSK